MSDFKAPNKSPQRGIRLPKPSGSPRAHGSPHSPHSPRSPKLQPEQAATADVPGLVKINLSLLDASVGGFATFTGQTQPCHVDLSTSVAAFRESLRSRLSDPSLPFEVMFNGENLTGESSLASHGIEAESVVHVICS